MLTPYRVEVVQGNVITQEQVALVKPGMTRAQVRDVLGSPLLTDLFHADRWDYVFTIRRQGAEPQLRRDRRPLQGRRAEEHRRRRGLPSEREFVASIDTFKTVAQRAAAGPDRRADQGAAGAAAPAAARAARRRCRRAPTRRSSPAHDERGERRATPPRRHRRRLRPHGPDADRGRRRQRRPRARRRVRRRRQRRARQDASAFLGRPSGVVDRRRPARRARRRRGADRLHPARGHARPPGARAASSASPR